MQHPCGIITWNLTRVIPPDNMQQGLDVQFVLFTNMEANVPCNCDLRCTRMPFCGAESLGQTLRQNSPLCFTPHHNSSNTQWYISYAPVHTTLLDMLCVLNLRQILNAWILAINLKRKRTRSHTRYHPFLAIARNHTDKATKRTLPLSLPHG